MTRGQSIADSGLPRDAIAKPQSPQPPPAAATILTSPQQVAIAADDEAGARGDGAGDDMIVVRIAADTREAGGDNDSNQSQRIVRSRAESGTDNDASHVGIVVQPSLRNLLPRPRCNALADRS